MRGVPHMPSRLALYLLLQKPLKPRGKPALVSPCRNLPDCLAVGAVRRKPLCGKFREDPGKFWDGGRIPASYYLLHLVAESWGKTREICPENGACSGDAKSISEGDFTKPYIQEAVAEFQSAPPAEARGDPPLSRIEAETCFVSIRSPRRSEGR